MNRNLARYVRTLREMKANGFTVDVMIELAFGPGGVPASNYTAEERACLLDLYRKELPRSLQGTAQ